MVKYVKRFSSGGDGDHESLRDALIEKLKTEGLLTQPRVEAAFRQVPRHVFLPDVPAKDAYRDIAIPTKRIGGVAVSSSSQPAIMAIMLEQLDLRPGQRVLEIGAGTGYNAALMAHIVGSGGEVITVDIDEEVAESAEHHLREVGATDVRVIRGDGSLGYPEGAPFDRIILTVGAPDILPAWWEQLAPQGRLVLPLSLGGPQASIAFDRVDDHLAGRSIHDCGFMRLRGPFAGREDTYTFDGEPGLFLTTREGVTADPRRVHALLLGPYRDRPVHTRARPQEVWGNLRLWVALHDARGCALTAESEATERNLVPPLLHSGGPERYNTSYGLLGEDSIHLLTYGVGDSSAYDLYVRSFGQEESAADRLAGYVIAWDSLGRPATDRLQVDVYHPGTAPEPGPGAILVHGQWSDQLLRWS